MDKHLSTGRWLWVALAAAALLPGTAQLDAQEYLTEDVYVRGTELHGFTDGGQRVTVVLGDFSLRAGDHTLRGRDAVLWISQKTVGNVVRRDITVYIEGKAVVTEPDGTRTTDKSMLVRLRAQGRMFAEGRFSRRKLTNFPLYVRARKVRAQAAQSKTDERKKVPAHEAPELIILSSAGGKGTKDAEKDRPAPPAEGEDAPADAKKLDPNDPTERVPHRFDPVLFRADNLTMKPADPNSGHSRVIVARGDVYLSQGNVDSEMHLELRSQGAVVFTGPAVKKDGSPLAPRMGAIGPTSDPNEAGETIHGVYLESDVVITRGERTMRAQRAYYEFTRDRAMVIDPVMRTVQEQRDIPVYIRAREARVLSAREMWFRDARISTSDFHTPTYHVGAGEAYLMDKTPYAEDGEQLGDRRWLGELKHVTFNVRSVPILYWPETTTDFEQDHTALRKLTLGNDSKRGFGVESEWHFFRLAGLVKPEGFDAKLHADGYERGGFLGVNTDYIRDGYSGYAKIHGMVDEEEEDDFGEERKNVDAQKYRGRILWRHKQEVEDDWLVQAEVSYYCDRNYIESFFRDEWYAGKEQENLLYARKQKDNWAVTGLLAAQLNRFEPTAEAAPSVAFYLLGEPFWENRLNVFHESHLGLRRYRYGQAPDGAAPNPSDSRFLTRADTRNEINLPFSLLDGKVNATAYAAGRLTYWGDTIDGGQDGRAWGQVGVKANMNFWKIYHGIESRLFDVHGVRHIVTPTMTAFAGASNVAPDELYPIDPGVERHMLKNESGVAFGVKQRWQTRRGPRGDRRTVDWMKLNITAGFFDNGPDTTPSNGRFFFSRPEYSIGRNFINGEYVWNISDATALLADMNYDTRSGKVKLANVGLALQRNPRTRLYFGWRYMHDLDASVGTVGMKYKVNPKYTLSLFEQYDFDFRGRRNLRTVFTVTRKWPRWYSSVSLIYGTVDDGEHLGVAVTIWPEGIDEVQIRTGRLSLIDSSTEN
jgi:hypothetical protein